MDYSDTEEGVHPAWWYSRLITSIRFHDDSIPQQHSGALNVYQLVGTNIRFITTCSLVLISQEDEVLLMVLQENHDHLNGTN